MISHRARLTWSSFPSRETTFTPIGAWSKASWKRRWASASRAESSRSAVTSENEVTTAKGGPSSDSRRVEMRSQRRSPLLPRNPSTRSSISMPVVRVISAGSASFATGWPWSSTSSQPSSINEASSAGPSRSPRIAWAASLACRRRPSEPTTLTASAIRLTTSSVRRSAARRSVMSSTEPM